MTYRVVGVSLIVIYSLVVSSCGITPRVQAQSKSMVSCDKACTVSIDAHTATMITESYQDASQAATFDFPLQRPITIDSVAGTLSYKGMSGECAGKEIAIVGFISGNNSATGEGQHLVAYDLYTYGDKPVNIAVNQNFPDGITIDSLHETVLDDLCHTTDFRAALVFHFKN